MLKMFFRSAVLVLVLLSMTTVSYGKDFKYVGVKKCKTCHSSKKIGAQYKIWAKAKHANALKSLSSPQAMEYAKKNGIADPSKDAKCLNCHSTYATIDHKLLDSKTKMTVNEGVFSLWKGQQAVYSLPFLFNGTRALMTSTISLRAIKSSIKFCGIRPATTVANQGIRLTKDN